MNEREKLIYCCKNNHCIAKYGHQQKHCTESLPDDPFDKSCQYWHHPNKCGIAHLIENNKKVRCTCDET